LTGEGTENTSEGDERIRKALVDLSFERGYAAITLDELLARAEVEEPTFRDRFEDLEDCLCRVLEEIRRELLARIERAAQAHECWRERIRAAGYVLWGFLREDERVAHLAIIEARRAGERPQRLLSETIDHLVDLLDEGRKEYEGPEQLSRATSEALAARIFDHVCLAIEEGRLNDGGDTVRLLIYEAVRPFLGADAAARELNVPLDPEALGLAG
jgi:AcrR family transcriptional regulator